MTTELATFGGGCFWCTEAVFRRVKGVLSVTSGYSGGETDNPDYEAVSEGITGHAESIQIKFNPSVVSYEILLEIFFATHDPTTFNRQGNDVGAQYRSVIFYHNNTQKEAAQKAKEKAGGELKKDIMTQIVPFVKFYPAEGYHQEYFEKNPDQPYCMIVINPKVEKLLKKYGDMVKEEYKNSV